MYCKLKLPKFATYLDNEVEGKQNITSYEFMTWILQNFDTVEEIKSFDLEKTYHLLTHHLMNKWELHQLTG